MSMRSSIFSLALLVASSALRAQPTIYAADHLPVAGSSRTLHTRNLSDDPPPGGENVTWDFSGFIAQGTAIANYMMADHPDFPDATLAIESGGLSRFLSVTDDVLQDHGYYAPDPECTMVNSNTRELLPPQMAYGDE